MSPSGFEAPGQESLGLVPRPLRRCCFGFRAFGLGFGGLSGVGAFGLMGFRAWVSDF